MGSESTTLIVNFPAALAKATNTRVFAYSRGGYGKSNPVQLPRPLDFMQREAKHVLPALLDKIGFKRGILVGHSDGGTIAAAYAGSVQDHRVRGVVLIGRDAPSIAAALGDSVPIRSAADMEQAVARAAQWAEPGDSVLLSPACASFDMFSGYEERGAVFAAAVRRLAGC